MSVGTYRKKPVTVEAMLFDGDNLDAIREWANSYPTPWGKEPGRNVGLNASLKPTVYTMEGNMLISPGDWLIRGVKGEFYPCKPDIFEATYEPAGATACERDGHIRENKTNWCMVCNQEVGPRSADRKTDNDG